MGDTDSFCGTDVLTFEIRGVFSVPDYGAQQKDGWLECGWWGNNLGVITYSFNLNTSPKTVVYGMLQCDIVMLQNYILIIL